MSTTRVTVVRSLKGTRWLSDTTTVVLAMHPYTGMTWHHIEQAMRKFGWQGTKPHARVAISRARPYVQSMSRGIWQLTVQGRQLQVTILRDMGECIALSNARLTARHETVTTADGEPFAPHTEQPNGN